MAYVSYLGPFLRKWVNLMLCNEVIKGGRTLFKFLSLWKNTQQDMFAMHYKEDNICHKLRQFNLVIGDKVLLGMI